MYIFQNIIKRNIFTFFLQSSNMYLLTKRRIKLIAMFSISGKPNITISNQIPLFYQIFGNNGRNFAVFYLYLWNVKYFVKHYGTYIDRSECDSKQYSIFTFCLTPLFKELRVSPLKLNTLYMLKTETFLTLLNKICR